MSVETDGEYRVLSRREEGLVLIDRESDYEPVLVGDVEADPDLLPGYVIDGRIAYDSAGDAVLESAAVRRRSRYEFVAGAETVFQAARNAWGEAQAAGDGMNSQVTQDTDGRRNGVLYVFADDGVRGRFEEFRSGERPIEPLVDRVNEREGPAERTVFVVSPATEPFVIVYIVLEKGGQLDDAMRETYDRPEPEEPGTAASSSTGKSDDADG